ncbi:MAG: HAD hydrolase-like protein [Candidatus Portnoybacteria bacterium]|nr:HAD hydrolase-like protein [Candidatus Portnoybacteria bacterium]
MKQVPKQINAIIFDWGRTLYDHDNEQLFPEAKEVLEYLSKKYMLAIVSLATDGNIAKRWKIIIENDLGKYFDSILFDPEDKGRLYEITLQTLNVKPEEVVIVDDRTVRGIQWGNEHGTMTIWVKKGKFSNELPNDQIGQPTHTIETLTELKTLL